MKIEERKVNKAQRGELNGVLFKRDGKECAPTFYIEDFYKAYKDGTPIADLSHEAVDTAVRSSVMADILAQGSLEMLGDPDYLRVRLLNKGRNKEYLKGIPFRELGGGFVFIAEIGCGEYGAVITDADTAKQIADCAVAGADIVTCGLAVFQDCMKHAYTNQGLKTFCEAWDNTVTE